MLHFPLTAIPNGCMSQLFDNVLDHTNCSKKNL